MAAISKIYTKILASLLAFLGFSGTVISCNGPIEHPPSMYGVPAAIYKAKGVVVSETDNTPIPGIRAVLLENYDASEEQFQEIGNAAYSNNSGNFNVEGESFNGQEVLYVELTDIDGEENGIFMRKVVEADFSNATFTGGSGSYEGEAKVNLGTIKMIPDDTNTPQ